MDVTKGGNKWGNKGGGGGRGRREGREGRREGREVTKKPHITIANSASQELYLLNRQIILSSPELRGKTPEEKLALSFLSDYGNETVPCLCSFMAEDEGWSVKELSLLSVI